MNYQNQLTGRRRDALWRQIERLRRERGYQGKRTDQVHFSAMVVIGAGFFVLGALLGMALATLNHL